MAARAFLLDRDAHSCGYYLEVMIQPITKERWQEAQIAEAGYHANAQCTAEHYRRSYECYFKYLGMSFDQKGKSIVEIGCSEFPALSYCQNVVSNHLSPQTFLLDGSLPRGIIIEPLITPMLRRVVDDHGLYWIRYALEDMGLLPKADEVWLLNVMQHIIDPELFVSKCKQIAPVIRFFEPIDFGTSDCHPHTYSIDDFIRWFGQAERYKGGSDEGFHTADCAYGTWRAA